MNSTHRPAKVLHVQFPVGWRPLDATRVFREIINAKDRGLSTFSTRLKQDLDEISLHLATRAGILKYCVELQKKLLETVTASIVAHTQEDRLLRLGSDSLFQLLLSIDSFLFESKAYDELLRKFFIRVLQMGLTWDGQIARDKYDELTKQGGEVDGRPWNEFLSRQRTLFTHGAAPGLAIDLSREEERVYDILIMSENIQEFSTANPNSYFHLIRDFNDLILAIQGHAEAVEGYLVTQIGNAPNLEVS